MYEIFTEYKKGENKLLDGGVIGFCVNLYKKYTSLKSRELEELSRFRVMSWQPFQLP